MASDLQRKVEETNQMRIRLQRELFGESLCPRCNQYTSRYDFKLMMCNRCKERTGYYEKYGIQVKDKNQ